MYEASQHPAVMRAHELDAGRYRDHYALESSAERAATSAAISTHLSTSAGVGMSHPIDPEEMDGHIGEISPLRPSARLAMLFTQPGRT